MGSRGILDPSKCPACRQSPVVDHGVCSTHLETYRQISDAMKICTEALHEMPPCVRVELMEQLRGFYSPDGSYRTKVAPNE